MCGPGKACQQQTRCPACISGYDRQGYACDNPATLRSPQTGTGRLTRSRNILIVSGFSWTGRILNGPALSCSRHLKQPASHMSYKISVLISTYDDAELVDRKLDEICRQSIFGQAEFIFIETASPGREREVLAPFCEIHNNCRLLALDDRKTLYEAWNLGWDMASAKIICYSNMDDCMHPKLLEEVVTAMDNNPWDACSVLIAKQPLANIDRDDMWSINYLKQCKLSHRPGPFTAWRASIRETIGQFDGAYYGAGDKDFWARIQASGTRYGLVRKVLYLYSKSPRQLSKSAAGRERRSNDKVLADGKPYPLKWPYRKFPYYSLLQLWLRLFPQAFCLDID